MLLKGTIEGHNQHLVLVCQKDLLILEQVLLQSFWKVVLSQVLLC